ncbi:nonstructural protein 1 [Eptesicus fuscus bocavirus]|nr:nonstructural protein 1 [Eptesicus fuscus bocavirus]
MESPDYLKNTEIPETIKIITDDIKSFYKPAYTYILKLPFDTLEQIEEDLMNMLSPKFSDTLKSIMKGELDNITKMKEINYNDGSELEDYRINLIPDNKGYLFELAQSAYDAVNEYISIKKGLQTISWACWVQAEISEQELLHIHVVLGSRCLNKHNAKRAKEILCRLFLQQVKFRLENYRRKWGLTPSQREIFHQVLSWLNTPNLGNSELISILQYTDRRGFNHAQQVDPKTFIQFYLLPKNRKLTTKLVAPQCTPNEAYFVMSHKTYGSSILNGHIIPSKYRHTLWSNLEKLDEKEDGERELMMKNPWEDLPQVNRNILLKEKNAGGKNRITKKTGLMLDMLTRCKEKLLTTYEDMVKEEPELLLMLESSGGTKLIEQLLNMLHIHFTQTFTAMTMILTQFDDDSIIIDTNNKAMKLFLLQGYNPFQAGHWLCCVLNKESGKQNTINFYGPASTGKTNMAKAIVNACLLYGCVNHSNKGFVFNDCAAKLIVWWEECVMHADWVEPAKCIFGGTEFRIDRKHKDSMILPKTPVVISTNHNIYEVVGGNATTGIHSVPLKERIIQFNFMKQLQTTFGEITKQEIAELLCWCWKEYDCSLTGFLKKWTLDRVPNAFPLNDLCPSHSQTYILNSAGFCESCGGYLQPLSSKAVSAPTSETTQTADKETQTPSTPKNSPAKEQGKKRPHSPDTYIEHIDALNTLDARDNPDHITYSQNY